MKLIFATIVFVFAVVVTGGVYYFVRKPESKNSDLSYVKGLPSKFGGWMKSAGEYLTNLFATKPAPETEAAA
jgi:flagellar basal body-associated protein FliL